MASSTGAYYKTNEQTKQIYSDLLLNLNRTVGDFKITASVGASLQDVNYSQSSFGGFLLGIPNIFTFANVDLSNSKISEQGYHDRTNAVFATASVGWKNKVFLDGTWRNDWVSALAFTDKSSISYPSVGLSSVLTDLLGVKSNFLSYAKARISYSEVGNAPLRYISNATYPISNGYPVTTTYKPASNLQPERTKSYEAGLNLSFFDNSFNLGATVYKSSTYNQLFNPTLSVAIEGYSSFYVNAGEISNKGLELTAGYNKQFGDIRWTSNFTYSLNRNKIIKLLPSYTDPLLGVTVSLNTLNMGGAGSSRIILNTGGSMGDLYVNRLKTDDHGNIFVNTLTNTLVTLPNDYVYAGNTNPAGNLGFRNQFNWKGIDIGFLVTARIGGVGTSVTQALMDAYGVSAASATARDNGGVMVNGYKFSAQTYYQTIGGGTSGIGAMYVYSMTNVRLGEASVGYDIPVSKKVKWMKGLNVSLTGHNLLMIYNRAPFDPENTASTGTYYQGIDYFMQPSLRSIGASVRAKF